MTASVWTASLSTRAMNVQNRLKANVDMKSGRATRIVMTRTTTLVAIGTVVIAAGRTITSTVRNANAWTAPTNPRATIASMISEAVVDQKITSEISTAMITTTTRVATGTRVTAAARQTTTNFAKTASARTVRTRRRETTALRP